MADKDLLLAHCGGSMVFRYFLGIFLLVGVVLAGAISVFYSLETKDYQSRLALEEQLNVKLQVELLRNHFEAVKSDLLFLSRHNELTQLLGNHSAQTRGLVAREYLEFSRRKGVYDQIRYLDDTGMEIVRVNYNRGAPVIVAPNALQSKADRYYFADTMALGPEAVFVSPFDLNIERGEIERPHKPVIRFGTPVYDAAGRKRGVVILNYIGSRLISRIREIAGLSLGNAMLVNSDGYWLVSPRPGDEWGFMFDGKRDRTFPEVYPDAWQAVSASQESQVHTQSGLFTSATICPMGHGTQSSSGSSHATGKSDRKLQGADYYWKIISHIPNDALGEATHGLLVKLFFLTVLLFLLSSLPSWFIAQAIVRRRLHQVALFHFANHDRLTELPNRALFMDRLGQVLLQARRYERRFAVLFIDLDDFKRINDRLGHNAGDEVLNQTARRLSGCVRKSDTVARMGGDEFTVLLSSIAKPADAETVARNVIKVVSAPVKLREEEVTIGASVGISLYPEDGWDVDELVRKADDAMYLAKRNGKNHYHFSDEQPEPGDSNGSESGKAGIGSL